MIRLLRYPLVHFLLIALSWMALRDLCPPSPEPIAVSDGDISRARLEWRRETVRMPSDEELLASIEHDADQTRLVREALRLNLDRRDVVVVQRIQQSFALLGMTTEESADLTIDRARQLGMMQSDLVLRRRLAQRMRAHYANGVPDTLHLDQSRDDPNALGMAYRALEAAQQEAIRHHVVGLRQRYPLRLPERGGLGR